jgi:hypothetical protein
VKLLTLLLSLFVLTLSSVPCCALENSEADHPIHENSRNDDGCGQACSPFYTCGTCVGFTPNLHWGELFADYLRDIQHNSIYPSFELPQTSASIWQPPQ